MALDKDALRAVELLLAYKPAHGLLRNSSNATLVRDLKSYLDVKSDADRSDYDAIIVETVRRLPQHLAALPATRPSAENKPTRPGAGRTRPQSRPRYPHGGPPGVGDLKALSAPYRFIALPDEVVLAEPEALRAANEPLPDGYSATIDVEWIAETPLLIGGPAGAKPKGGGEAVVEPLAIGGRFAIPGSTQRGLLRAAVEIVSFSKLTQANLHYRFGLRDFQHHRYRREGSVSTASAVRAGFLHLRPARQEDERHRVTEDGSVFEITPAAEWHRVTIDSIRRLAPVERALQRERTGWSGLSLLAKYAMLGMTTGDNPVFAGKSARFRSSEDQHGNPLRVADPEGPHEGVFVVSDKLPGKGEKRYEYMVVPDPAASPIAIAAETAELFERLYSEPAKGELRQRTGSWKLLEVVARQGGIPVFYVGDPATGGKEFFFGLTRLFKIPHLYSVGEKLYATQGQHKPKVTTRPAAGGRRALDGYENVDFAESLFGYVLEPRDLGLDPDSTAPGDLARKGRIAVGYAFLDPGMKDEAVASSPQPVIQMAPRASFAPFYLRSGEYGEKDWSAQGSRLAGRKAYLPRFEGLPTPNTALSAFEDFSKKQFADNDEPPKPDVVSRLSFLVPKGKRPLAFRGAIRLDNVTAAQLGALLFALTHGGDAEKRFRHMMGRGKPFGAGQMRVGRLCFHVVPNDPKRGDLCREPEAGERFDPTTGHGWLGAGSHSLEPFLAAFETLMRQSLGKPAFPAVEPIEEWLGAADPKTGAEAASGGRLGYKPLPGSPDGPRPYKQFTGYGDLRRATQQMDTRDKPLRPSRLLPALKGEPPRRG